MHGIRKWNYTGRMNGGILSAIGMVGQMYIKLLNAELLKVKGFL